MIHLFFRKYDNGQPVWGERRRYICQTREEADAVISERENAGWVLEDEQGQALVPRVSPRPKALYTNPEGVMNKCEEDTLCACLVR